MGYKQLIESLRAEAEQIIESIWQEKRKEADTIKEAFNKEMERFKDEYITKKKMEILKNTESLIFMAKRKAYEIRLNSERELLSRIYYLGSDMLPLLRDETYPDIFGRLASEIIGGKWKRIIVNPEDVALAKKYFENAEVAIDRKISGGFVVISEDGRIIIDNTFEKRLERAWQSILPEIIKEIYSYVPKEYRTEGIS